MANLCEKYTAIYEALLDALLNIPKTGNSYRIAGRTWESHNIKELSDEVSKWEAKMNRACAVRPGIRTRRICPSDL